MKIHANTAQQAENLYLSYSQLSRCQQAVLCIIALAFRPVGSARLNRLISVAKQSGIFPGVALMAFTPEVKNPLLDMAFIIQSQDGVSVNPLLVNRLVEQCIAKRQYVPLVNVIEAVIPVRRKYGWQRDFTDHQCIIRDYFYLGEFSNLIEVLDFNKNPQVIDVGRYSALIDLCFTPFDIDRFLLLPDSIQYYGFATAFLALQQHGSSTAYLLALLEETCNKNTGNQNLRYLLAEQYLFALRLVDFERLVNTDDNSCYALQLMGGFGFLCGEFEASRQFFELSLVAKNKYSRRKKQYVGGQLGLFYVFCLMALAGPLGSNLYVLALDQLDFERASKEADIDFFQSRKVLMAIIANLLDGGSHRLSVEFYRYVEDKNSLSFFLTLLLDILGRIWCGDTLTKPEKAYLVSCSTYFSGVNIPFFTEVCKQLDLHCNSQKGYKGVLKVDFSRLIHRKAQWDIALEHLIALAPQPSKDSAAVSAKPARIVWLMELVKGLPNFKALEQKQTAKGWSKGRAISLKRLSQDYSSLNYLSDADIAMCKEISAYQSWDYYRTSEYVLEGVGALMAATNLDNLYLVDDLAAPIELTPKEPELLLAQKGDQILLCISDLPQCIDSDDSDEAFSIKEVTAGHFVFTVFNAGHLKVAGILGEGGLLVPQQAKAKVLESVAAIAPMLNIHSDMDGLDTGLKAVDCDNYLVINIQPLTAGLEFTCVVMPFGEQGPAFKPAVGNANITAEIEGGRVATQRDLLVEGDLLSALDEHCPQFLAMTDCSLALDDLPAALETLEQLEKVVSETPMPFDLKLRWPRGKKITLTKRLESQHLQLAVAKKSEWFDLSGELKIDDDHVIELRKLLALVASSNGRFVQLGTDQILALSADLRKKLDQLNQVTDDGKFHALASPLVAEATTGMRMKTNHAWEQQSQKMHESNTITPALPKTLQAQLRDYQLEGFDWMCRLAHWGAGACLADDMGLGKTLQALAVLLARASDGPALVIAPTSVCFNWQQEALKFAPTLNVLFFADAAGTDARTELLADLGAFDCVVISYGLLQREIDILAKVHWHTIVADEAQALKNPIAKRSQAACALNGDFRVITSGTPIENNLTELWSLFRFINPGLLGNLKRFGARFSLPIENAKEDKLAARKASLGLKTLIQPFILRRMKNQVLTELPARTDINVYVELSEKEQTFYEALRLNAIDNMIQTNKVAGAGEQRIRMLAELVKLRQACCNPKLVMTESDLPSAKLAALDELLDELQKNNHKALIFSQFVGHLKLIRQHLDIRGISYQYLDGSTPQKDRAARVNAFQSGESEVFLISLKAGGSGLNLTAADYVIHMDPWWNPAVEEQASDRAHRMGQQRPVTIYRLIAKNTIEEKIVALHQHKRDLADRLLAGNENASQLSVDDLLNLLKETF